MGEWVTNDYLKIRAKLEHKKKDGLVRLTWEVHNLNKRARVKILSYYCPVYRVIEDGRARREMGVWVRGSWVIEPFKIANEHVKVLLYPEESRTYKWDWVEPGYYGLSGHGPWQYRLHLYYSVGHKLHSIMAPSNTIERVKDVRLGPFTSQGVIGPLREEFPDIEDFEERTQAEYDLYPTDTAAVIPDAVLRTDNGLVVVQLATYVTMADLQRVAQAITIVENSVRKLGWKWVEKVQGAVVAVHVDDGTRALLTRGGFRDIHLLRMKV
jgi:hypothetical protein